MDDIELVKAQKDGDEAAFAALIERYADGLFAFSYKLSGDRDLAEDAVQDAFVKAWRGLRSFDESRSFRSWIFSIAHNSTIDLLRKRKDLPFRDLDGEEEGEAFADTLRDEGPLPDEVADKALLAEALEETLGGLPVRSRSVVLLHDKEGLTFEEISRVAGEPLNTVKSRYRRAVLALRRHMHQKGLI